jgi:hypothetical protein
LTVSSGESAANQDWFPLPLRRLSSDRSHPPAGPRNRCCWPSLLRSNSSNTQPRNSPPENGLDKKSSRSGSQRLGVDSTPEIKRALRSGWLALACRTVSRPLSPPGSLMSTTARSTACLSIIPSAAAPSATEVTANPAFLSIVSTSSRTSLSSSTTRTHDRAIPIVVTTTDYVFLCANTIRDRKSLKVI